MDKRTQHWPVLRGRAAWFYVIWALVTFVLAAAVVLTGRRFIWIYLSFAVLALFAFRPGSKLYSVTLEERTRLKVAGAVVAAAVTILACVLPMGQLPLWNGELPEHRNQYELMAEALLEGRIEFNYGDEEQLEGLENPYDPDEREQAGVEFHWDHAYYNGHYYMYFGIVPVLLVFLPFRVLTGQALTTYHATQLFAALSIAGIFVLFWALARRFFKKLPYALYLLLAVSFSGMSVWYASAEPALYCTAITSAVALEIWSLYLFMQAVWGRQNENRQILLAGAGALLGALAFGCRPPVALANVVVLPMLVEFLRQRKFTLKLLGKLALAAAPYLLVGAALMAYNAIRFDSPFEFGQTYQLTLADQSQYSFHLDSTTCARILNESIRNFFQFEDISVEFPYLRAAGVFFNFPVLLLSFGVFRGRTVRSLQKQRMLGVTLFLFAAAVLITAVDVMWSPFLLERYRMDIYFLMAIGCYLVIGVWYKTCVPRCRGLFRWLVAALGGWAIVASVLLCFHTVEGWYPGTVNTIANWLRLR